MTHRISERFDSSSQITSQAFDAIADLKRAQSVDDLVIICAQIFNGIELPYFAFARFFKADATPAAKVLVGEFHPEWATRYIERGYAGSSLIAREMLGNSDPYAWSEVLRTSAVDRDQLRIYDEANDFGLADGLFTPCRLADGSYGAVVLGGNQGSMADQLARTMAEVLSGFMASEAKRLSPSIGIERRPLSRRQRDCLAWVREGKSSASIAAILQVSTYMVDEHVSAACKKLGVRTRIQAAVEATLLGLLD